MREAFGWSPDKFRMSFQSRFGPAEWLQPYTDKTVEALAKSGVKRMAIVAPGFSADCLETLEEIAMEGKQDFLQHGGEEFTMIPALNESQKWIDCMQALINHQEQLIIKEFPALQD